MNPVLPSPYGTHRVREPLGVLPQPAWSLDAEMPCQANELEIAVRWLHVDAASWHQMRQAAEDDPVRLKADLRNLVASRGKLHNPVTGSGGMLLGQVVQAGPDFPNAPASGSTIASLVSLTLTPLRLDRILALDLEHARVQVEGRAILFATGLWSEVPSDLPEKAVLAALDVAGAPARTRLRTKPGDRVLILGGGGRSGLLASLAAREAGAAEVIAVDRSLEALARARTLGAAHRVIEADALDALALRTRLGCQADLTVTCVDIPGVEVTAILATKPTGHVLFFSMATSFQTAALAAEGLGSPVTMEIGNGYVPGHAREALDLLRRAPLLSQWFAL